MRTLPRSRRRCGSRTRRGTALAQPNPEDRPGSRLGSRVQLRTRAPEERGASVRRRIVDDLAQQVAKGVAEVRPRLEAEPDQVVAVDREVREPVRLGALPSELAPETVELLDVFGRRAAVLVGLAAIVGLLMIDELERDLFAVFREKTPRAERIALADLEHVVADDAKHPRAQRVRVAEPAERALCELAPDLLVASVREPGLPVVVQPRVRAAPGDVGLAEIVEERGQANSQRVLPVGRCLH